MLVLTAGVQKLLCGMSNDKDSVLLDVVGKCTEEVYLGICGHHCWAPLRQVISYLQKRCIVCCIATAGTLSQILLVALGFVQIVFLFAVVRMSITFLDRQ